MSIRSFIRQLDWSAPVRKVDLRKHWRLLICILLGASASTYIFHYVFPDVLWFFVLWCGFVTGATVGLLPGTIWQLASRGRHGSTSGKFIATSLLACGLFSLVAILLLWPLMRAHESERSGFRALAAQDVVSIGVFGRRQGVITGKTAIERFMSQVAASELYYPSHEISSEELKLSFAFRDGRSTEFAAAVPERHPKDISVETGAGEMLVLGGQALLEELTKRQARVSMVYDKNISPVGWYYGSYLLRFVELADKERDNLERRFLSWENTVIVKAKSLDDAYTKVERIGKSATKPYFGGSDGVRVKWDYLGITELLPIYEKLTDGAEIAWTERAPRKLRALKSYVKSRRSLGKLAQNAWA